MYSEYISKLPFWSKLNSEEQIFLAEHAFEKDFDRNTVITDDDYFCLAIMDGNVQVCTIGDDGREVFLTEFGKGTCGVINTSILLKQLESNTISVARTYSELLLIDSRSFHHLIDTNIYVRCFWFETVAQNLQDSLSSIRHAMLVSVDRRLASYLIRTIDESGDMVIHSTQEQIAQRINSVREVVARMLSKFEKKGILSTDRNRITILNPEVLREIAQR
ncbi:MAG: Crp/Fnr family transcriptional regulator [Lachnospiraceae bacterium]|nr:Crp/Fnr family transcriptional regulator [Candidatus Darwinimomas equi]